MRENRLRRGGWKLSAWVTAMAAVLAIGPAIGAAEPESSRTSDLRTSLASHVDGKPSQKAMPLANTTRAGGPVVFDGGAPDLFSGNEMTFWSQSEDFTLGSPTTIESCTFWTIEFGGWDGSSLQYSILSDASGTPGAVIASGDGTVTSRVATGRSFGGFAPEFQQEFDFEAPISLPAGTYWLRLHAGTVCDPLSVYWETGAPAFGSAGLETPGGDCGGALSINNGSHHAFLLHGESCVEELFASTTDGPWAGSNLYQLDPNDGTANLIGPIGFRRVGSLAFDPAGTLYGIGELPDGSGTDVLLTIDETTGAGTLVGPLGLPTIAAFGEMSFRPSDGALFAYQIANIPNHQLYQVDPLTGTATLVGASGYSGISGNGIAFDASGNLFMLNGCCGSIGLNLFDLSFGTATLLGFPTGLPEGSTKVGGMDYRDSDGLMYIEVSNFGGGTSTLATLNTSTSSVSGIGPTGIHADGLAWRHCGAGPLDPCDEETTDPIILNCPSDFTTTCNGEGGYYFNYYPDVVEDCSYSYELSWTNPIPFGVNELSVTVTDQAGNSATCEFTVTVVPDPKDPYRRFSIGAHDGWVRQPDMVNMVEGPVNTKASTFDVGDGSDNWGRRGVLSFDTSAIPADATITAAYIRLTRSTVAGNPAALGRLILDMGPMGSIARGGGGAYIGPSAILEPMDYDLAAAMNLDVAPSFPYPAANNYTVFATIDPAYYASIDRTGLTQFRVRFETESDTDAQNDFVSFHSGDASSTVVRPELVVEYYTEGCSPCEPANPCDGPTADTFWSTPVEDGGLMESHFTSEVGGTANSGATTSPVGDTASRQQLQVLLNFDTSSIPSDAQILSAELRVFRASATGGWSAFGPIWVGMRNPCSMPWWYGASGLLAVSDFEAINSIAPVGTLTVPATNTYTSTFLSPAGLAAINRGGTTQMKLYYPQGDDGDAIADQVQIGTGNYGSTSPGRPRLVVTYDPCGGGPITRP